MTLGFAPGKKKGQHYDLAMYALKKARKVNLLLKGQTEKHFEYTIVSHLQSSPRLRKNLITQIGVDEVEKMTKASLFGFSHWPDVSIGNSGTAVEIKVVQGGPGVRDILGQAIAYRMHYRFVILVLIDQTPDRKIVELCQFKDSQEYRFLSGLANELNIFTIVGPAGASKNVVFSGRRERNPVKQKSAEPSGNADSGQRRKNRTRNANPLDGQTTVAENRPFSLPDSRHRGVEDAEARYRAKWLLVRGLYDLGYNMQQVRNIFHLVDWMMHLRVDLDKQFRKQLDNFEENQKMPYVNSIERLARADTLLELLVEICGALPEEYGDRLYCLTAEQLQSLGKALLRFKSRDDLDSWLEQNATSQS